MLDVDTPIQKLELSQRATKALTDFGFKTLRDIVTATQWQMLRIPNIGRKSYNEIREVLDYHGYRFDMREYRLEKIVPSRNWELIETAPTDRVILVSNLIDIAIAVYDPILPSQHSQWRSCTSVEAIPNDHKAFVSDSFISHPTHWMDLPELPEGPNGR